MKFILKEDEMEHDMNVPNYQARAIGTMLAAMKLLFERQQILFRRTMAEDECLAMDMIGGPLMEKVNDLIKELDDPDAGI